LALYGVREVAVVNRTLAHSKKLVHHFLSNCYYKVIIKQLL